MKLKLKAFTMAEALIVMTMLGIIATIMLTTLKPAEFRDKGLLVAGKKILSEIDTATTQILINNTQTGTLSDVYIPETSTVMNLFTASTTNSGHLGVLYKKYLTAVRAVCDATHDCPCSGYNNSFYLKDGACVGITVGNVTNLKTRLPGETEDYTKDGSHGSLFYDTNGAAEPNLLGKDQFLLPLNKGGIYYD